MHLFTYGTLMFPEVWRRVVGRAFATRRAHVQGFAVFRVQDGVYPVMKRSAPLDRVAGIVHSDVDDAAVAALDEYESTLYDRIEVLATLDHGGTMICQAYVLPSQRADFASCEPWDADKFQREELGRYLDGME